jgi:hypothetical protein
MISPIEVKVKPLLEIAPRLPQSSCAIIANAGAKRAGHDRCADLFNLSRHCSRSTTTNAIENVSLNPWGLFMGNYRTPAKV